MAGDLPRNAGCCTRDEFLWLDTFTKAYKCFTALGFMVCVLSKRVCQQTMQHIPREQGKQLSSLAPSVRKPSNIVGQGANCSICCFGSLGGKTSSVCRAVCCTARRARRVGCPDRLGLGSRQKQALDGSFKCNFTVIALALL